MIEIYWFLTRENGGAAAVQDANSSSKKRERRSRKIVKIFVPVMTVTFIVCYFIYAVAISQMP
jgi:hypothetical protein